MRFLKDLRASSRPAGRFATVLGAAGLVLGAATAQAQPATGGPSIELAPEDRKPKDPPPVSLGAGTAPEHELVRGMLDQRFRSAAASQSSTAIGGYGEMRVSGTAAGKEGEREWVADLSRLVLFVAHPFNDKFRFYGELEAEHALACSGCNGALEVEQAFVDWNLVGDALALRAGLILVPMGIINQWHEPPVYHGVLRPSVETIVIPSTWRELGAGFFGQLAEPLRYELYFMTGLDPLGFSSTGIGGGRQQGSLARANAWAVVGRVELEPLLGAVIGVSGYGSDAGPNAEDEVFDATGAPVELTLPVIGWTVDARMRRSGLEWKVLFAEWRLPESGALMKTFDAQRTRLYGDLSQPLPTIVRGGYVEAAYDVLHPFDVGHQLLPFARLEAWDTQAEVPPEVAPNPQLAVRQYTFGLSYRPIQQVVFKADVQLRDRKLGFDETQINFGGGFMY